LVNNRYRKNTNDPGNYSENVEAGDGRFVYNVGSIQSIATSTGQNDSGVFELNFRDERYLPFENTGAISSWRLELPTEVKQFDYNTISDVIVHVKYTAREDGSDLKREAIANLNTLSERLGTVRLFSLKHDFPTEWHRFTTSEEDEKVFTAELKEEHYPFWSRNSQAEKVKIMEVPDNIAPNETELDAIGDFELTFENNEMDNVLIAIDWRKES